MLAVPPDKENYFVYLLATTLLFATVWVFSLSLSLSLPISHGMHLVVLAHPYFLWVVCHPNRIFPPKESEQEPQKSLSRNPRIGFPFSPLLDYALLPLTYDLTTSCIGRVQASDVRA